MHTVLFHLHKVQNQAQWNNLWLRNTHIGGNAIKKKGYDYHKSEDTGFLHEDVESVK